MTSNLGAAYLNDAATGADGPVPAPVRQNVLGEVVAVLRHAVRRLRRQTLTWEGSRTPQGPRRIALWSILPCATLKPDEDAFTYILLDSDANRDAASLENVPGLQTLYIADQEMWRMTREQLLRIAE